MRKVLVLEDEENIRSFVVINLKRAGYETIEAGTGEEALALIKEDPGIKVALLDIMLPGIDGYELLGYLRSTGTPVIFVTARTSLQDRVRGLNLGADDYLTKPFSVEELLARLRVTQRRLAAAQSEALSADSVFINGRLRIDFAAGCAYIDGGELHLTPIEYKLLCLLAKNVGKVLTHTFITQKIWGSSWDNDIASLRVFMATLRKKLEAAPDSPQYIQTHIGVGYRMLRVE